ncbi:Phage excisionase (fragment) [uncultured Alphaproteobacteria bacterium]|uniref:Phage excisionase n=1 Tax=uncultured Alphaproteobacteria bacterium TaxID=91750 RepID=A0A212K2D9_9PROT
MLTNPDNRLAFTVDELAEAAGISRAKAYADIASGKIPARRSDRRILVPVEAARAWLASLPPAFECE